MKNIHYYYHTSTKGWRNRILAAGVTVILMLPFAGSLAGDKKIALDIQPSATDEALLALAEASGSHIIFSADIIGANRSPSVSGELTLEDALNQLLAGTNLVYEIDGDDTVLIKKNPMPKSGQTGIGTSPRDGFILEEVTVTATKRSANIQDIPMSVTALSSEDIEKKGLVSMDDYLRVMPGVNMVEQGAGRKNPIVMRGIAAAPQTEDGTVGIYFGEVPLNASSASGGDWFGSPDIKLVDIERVEVLRGPQGTLFGSGSLGGTVRIIPASPDLQQFQAQLTTGLSNTARNGGSNYKGTGMVNLPLVDDELAVRVVGYRFKNNGYVNNIAGSDDGPFPTVARAFGGTTIDVDNIGQDSYTGGRISVRWSPNNDFEGTLSYLLQDIDQFGLPEVELGLDTYEQARPQATAIGGDGLASSAVITALELKYDFGWAELLSSSSLMDNDAELRRDITNIGLPADQRVAADTEVFVEELRLTSTLDGPFQYILGFYYEDVDWTNHSQANWTGNPALNVFAPGAVRLVDTDFFYNVRQKALFGEISYDIFDEWSVTLGGRAFTYDRLQEQKDMSPVLVQEDYSLTSGENGKTYKVNVTYTPHDDAMIYTQWSEGFRLGKPVQPLFSICDPDGDGKIVTFDGRLVENATQLESDSLESYEVGGKFSLFDKRMVVNAAAYQINWEGIPITIHDAASICSASRNAGKAQSRGVELESSLRLTETLEVNLGFSYINAKLTEEAGVLGKAGDRLPGSPEFNANLGLQYDFMLVGKSAFVRGDYAYVGGFYNNLQEVGIETGDYHQLNMKAGITLGAVNVDLFINNLTNADDLTWVNAVITADARAYRLRPRTIGLQATWSY